MFEAINVDTSSTYHELKAVFYVLKSHVDKLRSQRVKVSLDNMGTSRILTVEVLSHTCRRSRSIYLAYVEDLKSPWIHNVCPGERTLVPTRSAGSLIKMTGV